MYITNHSEIQTNPDKSHLAVLKYLNRIDKKYKSKYRTNKIQKVKNSLLRLAKK